MGLTIHWDLQFDGTFKQVQEQLEKLRQRCLDLPFLHVDDHLTILKGKDCEWEPGDQGDPLLWFKIQGSAYVPTNSDPNSYASVNCMPKRLVGFNTTPGEGSEPMNIILAEYPKTVRCTGKGYEWDEKKHEMVPKMRRIRTNLNGWAGHSFCKTQYASNPDCGGVANFLRCHLSVVRALDYAKELGMLKHVSDEGDFWEKRDVQDLAETVGSWNTMIAGFIGALNDKLPENGGELLERPPITRYPDFEHLEAKGQNPEGIDKILAALKDIPPVTDQGE